MSDLKDNNLKVYRSKYFAGKVIFIDGLGGCGKTLFSRIISTFNRVELLTFAYEIEWICTLFYLNKISKDAAVGMIQMFTDYKLYDIMQSRQVNFRPSDLSSVWRDANKWRYILRLFKKGDENTIERIRKEKPILSITTHHKLGFSEPIFSGLKDRALILNILRHPLYMLIQNHLNMVRVNVNDSPRAFSVAYLYNGHQLYSWTKDWKDLYLKSNAIDKAIYYLVKLTEIRDSFIAKNSKLDNQILSIPFEKYVLNPQPYLDKLEKFLGTKMSHKTKKVLKKQKVPRKKISDGIPLAIYKRCGWEPPKKELTEQQELDRRREYALSQGASKEAMKALDNLCQSYEKNIWSP